MSITWETMYCIILFFPTPILRWLGIITMLCCSIWNNKWILNMTSEWTCVSPYSSKKFNMLAAVWFKPTPWEDKLGNTYLLFTYNNNCKTFKSCCRCTHAVLKGKVLPCCTIKILINSNLKISLYCQNSLTTAVWSFLTHLICIPYSVYRGPLLFHDGLATANGC